MLAALAALAVTGGLYAAAAAAFAAMLWTVFQLVMWVFGG
jgi:hypothetical protein